MSTVKSYNLHSLSEVSKHKADVTVDTLSGPQEEQRQRQDRIFGWPHHERIVFGGPRGSLRRPLFCVWLNFLRSQFGTHQGIRLRPDPARNGHGCAWHIFEFWGWVWNVVSNTCLNICLNIFNNTSCLIQETTCSHWNSSTPSLDPFECFKAWLCQLLCLDAAQAKYLRFKALTQVMIPVVSR